VPNHFSVDGSPTPLFFTVDYAAQGKDRALGKVYLTSYLDLSYYATRLVPVLPALVAELFGEDVVKQWFHPGSLVSSGEVQLERDENDNWTGEFTTSMENLHMAIVGEAVNGFVFELGWDQLPGQGVLLTADDASVDSFGTVLGRPVPPDPPDPPNSTTTPNPQPTESAIQAEDSAAAPPQRSGGAAG